MELRNVPRERVVEYLIEAGGEHTGEYVFSGDGWHAELIALEPVYVSVIEVRRDQLIIEGDADAVQPVYDHLRRKTMRGGG